MLSAVVVDLNVTSLLRCCLRLCVLSAVVGVMRLNVTSLAGLLPVTSLASTSLVLSAAVGIACAAMCSAVAAVCDSCGCGCGTELGPLQWCVPHVLSVLTGL